MLPLKAVCKPRRPMWMFAVAHTRAPLTPFPNPGTFWSSPLQGHVELAVSTAFLQHATPKNKMKGFFIRVQAIAIWLLIGPICGIVRR